MVYLRNSSYRSRVHKQTLGRLTPNVTEGQGHLSYRRALDVIGAKTWATEFLVSVPEQHANRLYVF